MSIKYVMPNNAQHLDELCGRAFKSVKQARIDVQIAAVAVLMHAHKCGDWTKANYLVQGLGNTVNGQSLVAWFVKYGGLKVNEESQQFSGWSGKEFIQSNFQEAKKNFWWDAKKVNPFKGFDLEQQLQRILKSYNKALEKAKTDEDKEKVSVQVSEQTIQSLLKLTNFENLIIED